MWLYASRRLALTTPTLIVAVVLIAFIIFDTKADRPNLEGEWLNTIPNQSITSGEAFSTWLLGLVRGDLGMSVWRDVSVVELIVSHLYVTLELLFLSLFVAYAIALPVSFYLSNKQVTLHKNIAHVVSLFALSFPIVSAAIGVLALNVLGGSRWPGGFIWPEYDLYGNLSSLLLPVIALALPFALIQIPHILAIRMGEMASQARLPEGETMVQGQYTSSRHGKPYAFLPVWSNIGLQVGMLLGSLIVIEGVFDLPGIGLVLLLESTDLDLPVFLGVVCTFLVLYALLSESINLFYGFIDLKSTRIRANLISTQPEITASLLRSNRVYLNALMLVCSFIFLLVFVGSLGSEHASLDASPTYLFQPPSAEHWLGTDEQGRDLFFQFLRGARTSFMTSMWGIGIALSLGGPLGLLAGALGGMLNRMLIGLSELTLAIPAVPLGIVLLLYKSDTMTLLAITIALASLPLFTRTTSAAIEQLKGEWAAPSTKRGSTIFKQLVLPILAQACFAFVIGISIESAISFFRVEVPETEFSLGTLMRNSMYFSLFAPLGLLFPALSAASICFFFMLLSDAFSRLAAQPDETESLPAVQKHVIANNSL